MSKFGRQIGRFGVYETTLREHPELVAEIFKKMSCVPVHINFHFPSRILEFHALSNLFNEVPDGRVPPDYVIAFTTCENDSGQVVLGDVVITCESQVISTDEFSGYHLLDCAIKRGES